MNAWRDYMSHKMVISKVLDADMTLPKICLMCNWAEPVHRYRALQQNSAERHEQAQKTNHKDSWNSSKHNRNYLPQVVTFQHRILCFEISELNV
jgi:hypothetical protein